MIEAFIFITAEPESIDKLGSELKKVKNVKCICAITGEYDLIAKVSVETFPELSNLIKKRLSTLPGVRRIETSIIMKTY